MHRNIQLKYIGRGAFLPNVPARDLTKEEVDQHGGATYLIGTGLYVLAVADDLVAEDLVAEEIHESSRPIKKKNKE